jgi:hypothetical protein
MLAVWLGNACTVNICTFADMDSGGDRQAVMPDLVSELERELRDFVEGS